MERFLFVYSWLSALTDGRFFRFVFSNLLRISAILLTIYLLGDTIENVMQMAASADQLSLPPLFVQFLLILSGYAVIHLLMLRSEEIRTLHDPRYALSEVVMVLSRLSGELLFVTIITTTLILLLQQLTPGGDYQLLPQLQTQFTPWISEHSVFMVAASGLVMALAGLVLGYLCSEILEMVLRIARSADQQLPLL